jgi:hypothetical protein
MVVNAESDVFLTSHMHACTCACMYYIIIYSPITALVIVDVSVDMLTIVS